MRTITTPLSQPQERDSSAYQEENSRNEKRPPRRQLSTPPRAPPAPAARVLALPAARIFAAVARAPTAPGPKPLFSEAGGAPPAQRAPAFAEKKPYF